MLDTIDVPKEAPEPRFPTIGAPVPLDSTSVAEDMTELNSKVVLGLKEASIDSDGVARVEI